MSDNNSYFLNYADAITDYVVRFLDNPTPLKVQKSLYFIWAFYSATYGNIDYSTETDFSYQEKYPKFLFPAEFEAGAYGPVLTGSFINYYAKKPSLYKYSNINDNNTREVISFINDILSQVNEINDFGLVTRACQDNAWRKAYKKGNNHCIMDNNEIKRDYMKYVNEQC